MDGSTKQWNDLADLAVQALLLEVLLSPKPGLVDRRNNGAHGDMDLPLFVKSAFTLKPYFVEALWEGATSKNPHNGFLRLREKGIHAEEIMFEATGGINTHKGAIFTFGLVLLSLGRMLSKGQELRGETVLQGIPDFVKEALPMDFSDHPRTMESHGERLHRLSGALGVRGEAMRGYPSLQKILPAHGEVRGKAGFEPVFLHALLLLMENLEDTNVLHRGGPMGLAFLKEKAREARIATEGHLDGIQIIMEDLDRTFIEKGLSPGGAADLLAVLIFFELAGLLN